ncbi:hypothetical protein COOONC_15217 [Cooperia oncophora]
MAISPQHRWAWLVGAPLLFSPLLYFGLPFRCAFCIAVLSTYWIVEVVPIGTTSLLPMFLFPVLGIESAKKICLVYFKLNNPLRKNRAELDEVLLDASERRASAPGEKPDQ